MEETATRGREPIGFSHFTHAQISGCPRPARPVQPVPVPSLGESGEPSSSPDLQDSRHGSISIIECVDADAPQSSSFRSRSKRFRRPVVNMPSCRHQPLSFLPAEANPPEEELRRPCCDGKRDSGHVNAGKAAGISQPSSSTVSRRGCQSQADSTVPDKSTRDVFRAPWPRGRWFTSVAQDNKYQRAALASTDPVSSV